VPDHDLFCGSKRPGDASTALKECEQVSQLAMVHGHHSPIKAEVSSAMTARIVVVG